MLVGRIERVLEEDGLRISAMTLYELERGLRKLERRAEGRVKRRKWNLFLSTATVFGLDEPTFQPWVIAADLHARVATSSPAITISEIDLLILATAMVHGMVLLTSDRRLSDGCSTLSLADHVECVALA